jgi:hypothetical protein
MTFPTIVKQQFGQQLWLMSAVFKKMACVAVLAKYRVFKHPRTARSAPTNDPRYKPKTTHGQLVSNTFGFRSLPSLPTMLTRESV